MFSDSFPEATPSPPHQRLHQIVNLHLHCHNLPAHLRNILAYCFALTTHLLSLLLITAALLKKVQALTHLRQLNRLRLLAALAFCQPLLQPCSCRIGFIEPFSKIYDGLRRIGQLALCLLAVLCLTAKNFRHAQLCRQHRFIVHHNDQRHKHNMLAQ